MSSKGTVQTLFKSVLYTSITYIYMHSLKTVSSAFYMCHGGLIIVMCTHFHVAHSLRDNSNHTACEERHITLTFQEYPDGSRFVEYHPCTLPETNQGIQTEHKKKICHLYSVSISCILNYFYVFSSIFFFYVLQQWEYFNLCKSCYIYWLLFVKESSLYVLFYCCLLCQFVNGVC